MPTAPVRLQVTTSESDDLQAVILTDGVAERYEYERAVAATVKCLRDKGIRVNGPVWTEDGRHYLYTMESAEDPGPLEQSCVHQFLDKVAEAWNRQIEPTTEERRQAEETFARCLIDSGVEGIRIGMNVGEMLALIGDTKVDCQIPFAIVIPPELVSN